MKRLISIFLTFLFLLGTLCGCGTGANKTDKKDSDKLQIIATLFPQYDFARQIARDKAEITLLLPPGMESHSFEPTPGDIIAIQESDIFLYTGDQMEPWVANIASNAPVSLLVADLSEGITLCKEEHDHDHEAEEGHDHEAEDHDHEAEEEHEHETGNHDHEAEEVSHEGHNHEYNPHIWTSPVLAMKMVENVTQALCQADPANEDFYRENAQDYLAKLDNLDQTFREIVSEGQQDTLYIGSRFSLYYFMEEYGLHYVAAYDSCEEEAEPSIKRVVSMIESMRDSHVTAIYYEELVEPYIANTIAEATDAEPLLFHTCHNLSKDELESGATYLSLMEQNAKNLKKGLQK